MQKKQKLNRSVIMSEVKPQVLVNALTRLPSHQTTSCHSQHPEYLIDRK